MLDNELLYNKVIQILDIDLERRDGFLDKIEDLINKGEDEGEVYREIIKLLTQMEFSPKEAVTHWKSILEHRDLISKKLERPVFFRVALLDYFLEIVEMYQVPMLVELYVYESARYNAMVDELTGIYNHRFLREFLWRETKRSLRYHKKYSVVFADIDNLKAINDNYGKLAGDEVLKSVARFFEKNMRIEDVIARYSSDEFVIMLPESDKEGAFSFCKRIKPFIEGELIQFGGFSIQITLSFGIATFIEDSDDPINLLELADKALYRAKFLGKNQIVGYSPDTFEI
jgi:diguanylate cyclase (GGDEF)-like protein